MNYLPLLLLASLPAKAGTAETSGQGDAQLLLALAGAAFALLLVNILFYKVKKALRGNSGVPLNHKHVNQKIYAH